MIEAAWRRSLGDRLAAEGVALAIALFSLAILGAVVAAGYLVAARQYRAAAAGPQASSALYAAEAGLAAGLARLDTALVDSLGPGALRRLEIGSLATGDGYEAYLRRLDDGGGGSAVYYLVVSTGRAFGPQGGRRQLALLLRRPILQDCCRGALEVRGPVAVVEGASVDGRDRRPDAWGAKSETCEGFEPRDIAGIVTDDASSVTQAGGAAYGNPAVLELGAADRALLSDFDRWMHELAALADIEYSDAASLDAIAPAVGRNGDCDRSETANWGAPTSMDHPCFNYFPIIHARGDLKLGSSTGGQGILLVEGDLFLGSGFEFYGVVLVRGRLIAVGSGGRLVGGVLVRNEARETLRVGGGMVLGYSSCAVERATGSPKLQLPHPLAQFSWFEILE